VSFAAETPAKPGTVFLSIEEVTHLALENNFDIQIAKFDSYVKRNDLLEALSIFDTLLSAGASYESNQFERSTTILGTKTQTNEYSIGLSKLLPTGTSLSLDLSDRRSFTNSAFAALNTSHEGVIQLSISQALGKNFFGLIDRNKIKITKKDIEDSDWSSLERIENSLADTQKAYWRVVLLTEELDIIRKMYKKAQALYGIYRNKLRFGLVEDPDLLAAQANMIQRQNDVLAAIDELNAAKNRLLLLLNADSRGIRIKPLDKLRLYGPKANFYESLKMAIENRKDYKRAKNEIEKRRLSLVINKNSLWPEIDLKASFARNGLSHRYQDAVQEVFEEDNPELFVGVTIKLPLENTQARGQYNKAKLQRARAIVELKKTERLILTEINDLVTKVNIQTGRVLTRKRVLKLQERKLAAEDKRFKFGRSSSDIMIRYQEDLLSAKLAYARALFEYSSILIDLRLAQNTLLSDSWEVEL
jgi:outer membrane protein TolC